MEFREWRKRCEAILSLPAAGQDALAPVPKLQLKMEANKRSYSLFPAFDFSGLENILKAKSAKGPWKDMYLWE